MVDIEIITQKKNELLKREEIKMRISHEQAPTPARDAVASKLAAMLNSDRDKTIIQEIKSEFGNNNSLGYANVYESKEDAMKIEAKHLLKRNGLIVEEE